MEADAEPEKTKKGGSFMCHKSYCFRCAPFTPAASQAYTVWQIHD
jgi:hypothetical protein